MGTANGNIKGKWNFLRYVALCYRLRFSAWNGRTDSCDGLVIKMCPCNVCAPGRFDILVGACSFINNKGRQFHFPWANRDRNVSRRHFGYVHLVNRRDTRSELCEHRLYCVTFHQQEIERHSTFARFMADTLIDSWRFLLVFGIDQFLQKYMPCSLLITITWFCPHHCMFKPRLPVKMQDSRILQHHDPHPSIIL